MAWGGARPGAGRKKTSETATASARTSLNSRATGAPAATAAPAQPLLPMKLPVIRDEHLSMARRPTPQQITPVNPFAIGKPPPGVVPAGASLAMDDAGGVPVQIGAWAGAQLGTLVAEGQVFLGYAYLSELSQRPEYRVMSETIATEMTKKWLKLKVKSEGDESKVDRVKQLEDEFDRLRVQDKFREAAEQDGLFGRSHLYLDTGATDDLNELRLPIGDGWDSISKAKVGKGDLKGLQNVEAIWTYPSNFNAINPLKPDWYKPTSWYTMATEVHASRLLTFVGREVPDLLKPSYFFGGLALTQIAKPYVDNWLRTRQSVSDLIHSFTVFVLSTDMESMLTPGGENFFKRLDLFNITRDNKGVMALNEGTEKLENISAPLGSLDSLQAQSMEQMAAVSRIPVVKLTGIEPKGLNASSEGSIKSFDDLILAYQRRLFDRHVRRIMGFAMLNIWGEVDPDIVHEWEPLRAMTAKEVAEMQKLKAETGGMLIDKGVLHPVEERERIASDPETEYDGLDVEDVPDLAEEEEQGLMPGKGGEGGKGGTGGEGGGEGGEAGDEAIVPFAQDAEWKESDHPRAPDGKFGSGGGGGAGKPNGVKAAKGPAINWTQLDKMTNQKGSNPGGVYQDQNGNDYYVKHLKSPAHKTNEYTAAGLYQLAGVKTLDYVPTTAATDVATKYTKLDADNVSKLTAAERKEAQKDFAIHAWLANYDAVGTGGDNIGVVNGQKGPAVLDVGGSLDFRAQGAPKGEAFGTDVTELKTMLDPKVAPDAAAFYGDMTASEKEDSVERVANIRDDDIRATVKENGGTPELAEKLIARKFNMAKEFGLEVIEEKEDPEFAKNHPRGPDGRFIKGAGGEKPKAEAGSGEFKSKKEHAAHLLQKGVTTKDMLKALGWPSISMPAMAKSLGMKLEKSKQGSETVYKGTPMTAEEKAQAKNDIDKAKLNAAVQKSIAEIPSEGPPKDYEGFVAQIENPMLSANYKEQLAKFNPGWANVYQAAKPAAPAAPKFPPATPAELEKAKKTTAVQQQYVKDWPTTKGGTKAAEKMLADFNEQYAGKAVAGTTLQQKVADFKKMQANISAINEGEKSVVAKQQAEANAQAAEELKKAQAAAKATTKQYMQELGISETEAMGFEALVKMQGGKSSDVIASFKKYQETAKKLGYPITGFQYALIRNYIDGGYGPVNSALRSGSMSAAQHVYAKLVNNAIDKMPKYTGTVIRGTSLDPKDIAKYQPGHVVREHGFTSTGIGFSFSGNVRYNIKSIGKRGADFSGGANPNEKEVLFKAGTFFLVHKVETKNGTTYVDMEEVEGHD